MKDQLSEEQIETIRKAMDEAIEKGPWDKSNFLRLIGKNLAAIRDGFLNKLGKRTQAQLKADAKLADTLAQRGNQKEVYVSLYSATGADFTSWERIVANLPRQMTSRPIYAEEEDLKGIIRQKENKMNEAYVAIYVLQTDIITLSVDKTSVDKLGKSLLTLKAGCLILDNVSRFVHQTGDYRLERGRLIK
jgi:intracellular multiplication protein IcmQ